MSAIDEFLNKLTMYRLVLYSLIILSVYAIILASSGILSFGPLNLIATLFVLIEVCFVANIVFAKIFKVKPNQESFAITALILFFIMIPMESLREIPIYIVAGVLAIGSKYVIVKNKKHIFNPVAFALVLLGLFGAYQLSWWVGSAYIFPVVFILGFLIVKKIKRTSMFFSYLFFALISISVYAYSNGNDVYDIIGQAIISWPLLFLGMFMLTEPQTSPPHKTQQIQYGALVGVLSGVQFGIGPLHFSPELALILGNIYSFVVSSRKRFELKLISRRKLSDSIYEFSFLKNSAFAFNPGQYMEWTLSHKSPDSRGMRRYFTVASSPTENEIKLGVRVIGGGSTFKDSLINMKIDDKICADNLSGDFSLPRNKRRKLVFIAGGIGVTPFRSIVKYLSDKNQKRDIVLLIFASSTHDFIYKDIFERAKPIGVKPIYILTKEMPNLNWTGLTGKLTQDLIHKEIPDYMDRKFYLSGPPHMIEAYKKTLSDIGVGPGRIVTDYFPGY